MSNQNDSEIIIEDGLRKVKPYYHDFSSHVKPRWIGMKVIDMYLKEFPYYSRDYLEAAILKGNIKLNGKKIDLDTVFKKNSKISHITHRHEYPVIDCKINILFESKDLLVIDKPASIPLHPCGRYSKNSVLNILKSEYNQKYLFHRMTSGVILIGKNKDVANEYSQQIVKKDVSKTYFAKVIGKLEDEVIEIEKKIAIKDIRLGTRKIDEDDSEAKESITFIYPIYYNDKDNRSIVFCQPKTGRTHQIRVHLEAIQHPISNDPIYGPMKQEMMEKGYKFDGDDLIIEEKDEKDSKKRKMNEDIDPLCQDCKKGEIILDPKSLILYLHAWCYKGKDWEYKSEIPSWITEISKDKIEEKFVEFTKLLEENKFKILKDKKEEDVKIEKKDDDSKGNTITN